MRHCATCTNTATYLDPDVAKDLQDRLSRTAGQVEGIKRMLAQHRDCETLLTQLAAARAALNRITTRLVENHMETCVAEAVKRGAGPEALARLKGALSLVLR
ncbi:MAG: metal-sensing transcriptional repressor [Candidatus Krumholzibacteriia bacterium]